MARLAMLAILAAESDPRPGGTPPWPTIFAITAIRLACSWSSMLYCWWRPLLPERHKKPFSSNSPFKRQIANNLKVIVTHFVRYHLILYCSYYCCCLVRRPQNLLMIVVHFQMNYRYVHLETRTLGNRSLKKSLFEVVSILHSYESFL